MKVIFEGEPQDIAIAMESLSDESAVFAGEYRREIVPGCGKPDTFFVDEKYGIHEFLKHRNADGTLISATNSCELMLCDIVFRDGKIDLKHRETVSVCYVVGNTLTTKSVREVVTDELNDIASDNLADGLPTDVDEVIADKFPIPERFERSDEFARISAFESKSDGLIRIYVDWAEGDSWYRQELEAAKLDSRTGLRREHAMEN